MSPPKDTLANLQLASCGAGRLTAWYEGEDAVIVRPVKCFPLSEPNELLSLRTEKNEEFAFIENPSDLDGASAAALVEALTAGGFTFAVTSIHEIREDFELRNWDIDTQSGRRKFQTALDTWPRAVDDGSFLVEDVFGDLYRFPPLDELDQTSAQKLWGLVG